MEFDEKVDYRNLHLEWIRANPSFRPKTAFDRSLFSSYFAFKSWEYSSPEPCSNKFAYICLTDDYRYSKQKASKTVNAEVAEMFGDGPPVEFKDAYFVTFNFDEKLFVAEDVVIDLAKFLQLSWIDEFFGVFEYNTEEGHHPHLMCRMKINKYKKAKLLDKLAESRLAKYCNGRNFIDVRPLMDYHLDYLSLDKTPRKTAYIVADQGWRKANNIKEYYEKK